MNFPPSLDDADDFWKSALGQYVLDWELTQHDNAVVNVFGYHAVQIGFPKVDYLRKNRILKRYCVGEKAPANLIANPSELPLETNSMDLVVLPHQLEFAENPHQILREVERILVPEGKLVIVGFNPFSLWGAYRRWTRRVEDNRCFPWNGHYISLSRLKDWLKLLNFEIETGCYGCYKPPYQRDAWRERFQFLEKAGNRWWPTAGAIYLIAAKKKIYGMRLMGQPWKPITAYSPESAIVLPTPSKKHRDE